MRWRADEEVRSAGRMMGTKRHAARRCQLHGHARARAGRWGAAGGCCAGTQARGAVRGRRAGRDFKFRAPMMNIYHGAQRRRAALRTCAGAAGGAVSPELPPDPCSSLHDSVRLRSPVLRWSGAPAPGSSLGEGCHSGSAPPGTSSAGSAPLNRNWKDRSPDPPRFSPVPAPAPPPAGAASRASTACISRLGQSGGALRTPAGAGGRQQSQK